MSAAHRQRLCGVSRTHVMSHEHTSLFITNLSLECLWHTANDMVVCHEHTSVVTETHFFPAHVYPRTACGTPPTTLVCSHENTSVVTNSNFVSSHIYHRALFGTLPSTWSLVKNSHLSSSQICHRNVCGTPPTTLWCVTNTRHEPRTHISLHHTSLPELFAARCQRLGGVSQTHVVMNPRHEPRTHEHVTNTHLVSSHICHRTICSTTPTTSRHQSQT